MLNRSHIVLGLLLSAMLSALVGCGDDAERLTRDIEASSRPAITVGMIRHGDRIASEVRGVVHFERSLIERFAAHTGRAISYIERETPKELFEALRSRKAHFVAGLAVTPALRETLRVSVYYDEALPAVVYRRRNARPRTIGDLHDAPLLYSSGSTLLETLEHATTAENVRIEEFAETAAESPLALLDGIWRKRHQRALVDDRLLRSAQPYLPEIRLGFHLPDALPVGWLFSRDGDYELYQHSVRFFSKLRRSGELAAAKTKAFDGLGKFDYVERRRMFKAIRSSLPKFRPQFEAAEKTTQIDWKLLAAIGYQESRWDPEAASPTGVRGVMMLTEATARELGVEDRLDPAQSIEGGARFVRRLQNQIANWKGVTDRTELLLVAYNAGINNLRKVRRRSLLGGSDAGRWLSLKPYLLALDRKGNSLVARKGSQAIAFVESVRRCYEALNWMERTGRLAATTK